MRLFRPNWIFYKQYFGKTFQVEHNKCVILLIIPIYIQK